MFWCGHVLACWRERVRASLLFVYVWDPHSYSAAVLMLTLFYLPGYVSVLHCQDQQTPRLATKLSQTDSVLTLPYLPAQLHHHCTQE